MQFYFGVERNYIDLPWLFQAVRGPASLSPVAEPLAPHLETGRMRAGYNLSPPIPEGQKAQY